VNDIAAARHLLDQMHDRGEVNTGRLVVIGTGEGASLGLLWLGLEASRYPRGAVQAGKAASHDVLGAIWIGCSLQLGGGRGNRAVGNNGGGLGCPQGDREAGANAFLHGENEPMMSAQVRNLLVQRMPGGSAQVQGVPDSADEGPALLRAGRVTQKEVLARV